MTPHDDDTPAESTGFRLRIPASLRHLVGGEDTLVLPYAAASDDTATLSISALLDALAESHPALERRIRDEQGRIRPHVNLFVGSDNVRDLDGPDTLVTGRDVLTLIPAVSGG